MSLSPTSTHSCFSPLCLPALPLPISPTPEIAEPSCDIIAFGCSGTFSGSYFQLVNSAGETVGDPIASNNTYVAGDMATLNNGTICWPYVSMDWRLDLPVGGGLPNTTTKKMSFGCMSLI